MVETHKKLYYYRTKIQQFGETEKSLAKMYCRIYKNRQICSLRKTLYGLSQKKLTFVATKSKKIRILADYFDVELLAVGLFNCLTIAVGNYNICERNNN